METNENIFEGESSLEIAGSTLWALACLMALLRSVQFGLMSRQAGPVIIRYDSKGYLFELLTLLFVTKQLVNDIYLIYFSEISMSYMMLDIIRFVGFFLVVYISYTFCTTYVYMMYADFNEDSKFVDYKKSFKYFFWALIRTGNPEFADIKIPVYASTENEESVEYQRKFEGNCLKEILENNTNPHLISLETMNTCLYFISETVTTIISKNDTGMPGIEQIEQKFILKKDEGISFVIGNVLWASYQFLLVIVLLSILRAKMINTYQSIIQEADVQWKFFR